MSVEILSDIIEQIADEIGVYGACDDNCAHHQCRSCYTAALRQRIIDAVEVDRRLASQAERSNE